MHKNTETQERLFIGALVKLPRNPTKNYPAVVLKSSCSTITLTAASHRKVKKAPLYKYT